MNRRNFLQTAVCAEIATSLTAPYLAGALQANGHAGAARSVFKGLTPAAARTIEEKNLKKLTAEIDALVAQGPFKANWDSLSRHKDPKWFRDAKFGIYTHWGPVTVGSSWGPPGSEWYGRAMYQESSPVYRYHYHRYAEPSKFGYKDIIPLFKGERFDPEAWADVFTRAGAKFAGPVAIHHDNYALWNSGLTRWNSVAVGPGRDVVGELEKAYRKRGLRFITTFHHGFAWRYYELAFAYDASDPQYSDLYTTRHPIGVPPSTHFQDKWLALVYEVLRKYTPDLIWFDIEFYEVIQRAYQQKLFATAYDWAARNDGTIGVTQKSRAVHEHTGILDFERGREDRLTPYPWLTDTSLSSWFYVDDASFRSARDVIGILVDIVAKNGCLLLNIGPYEDGTLPKRGVDVLLAVGDWLRMNGEAIYETRPWITYGEGPTHNVGGASMSEYKDKPYTAQDIRFTTRGNTLYAIALGWPGAELVIKSLTPQTQLWFGKIREVGMLGVQEPLQWKQEPDGLRVRMPAPKPGDHAFVLKIT